VTVSVTLTLSVTVSAHSKTLSLTSRVVTACKQKCKGTYRALQNHKALSQRNVELDDGTNADG